MISEVAYKICLKIMTLWSWWWEVNNEEEKLARTILTVSVPVLVFLWYKLMLFYTTKRSTPLPPGPYGLPLVGYLPFLGSNLHEIFTNMAQKYGPIFSLRLGSKLCVVVNSLDLVKVVSHDLDQTFANRSSNIAALTISYGRSNIAWSNNNKHWRNMRKLLVNVVTSMLWGSSKSSEDVSIGDGFREVEFKIMELLGAPNISDFIPMLSWFDLQKRKREMQQQFEYVNEIFDNIIQKRIKTNSSKIDGADEKDGQKDFLQIMLELKDQMDTPASFNMIHIKALLMDFVTAATDTTSTMVEWVMAEMLNNPDVMKRVQDELTTVVGINNIVEESHMPKLTYFDAVIKETFRLHPPLPLLIQRCPGETCKVDGYIVPKDTMVFMNVWAIHRDPNNWPEPLEFKPERFLNGKWDYSGNNLKFLPFGTGRRICPGMPLGNKMLMYILASLLHSFEWKLPKDDEFELREEFGLVAKKRKPLIAIPSQRLPHATLYM
ncbi:hypothetical protein QVD17_13387 [Tagetes erecta]|uniref:Cytochrome P450 n=1 Tax=Tagetes erecta TaxID=13708 RepID=A0AAD8P3F4_TARER|nr:hypothetical protein QVD17_13387 [Tagetes erecta]